VSRLRGTGSGSGQRVAATATSASTMSKSRGCRPVDRHPRWQSRFPPQRCDHDGRRSRSSHAWLQLRSFSSSLRHEARRLEPLRIVQPCRTHETRSSSWSPALRTAIPTRDARRTLDLSAVDVAHAPNSPESPHCQVTRRPQRYLPFSGGRCRGRTGASRPRRGATAPSRSHIALAGTGGCCGHARGRRAATRRDAGGVRHARRGRPGRARAPRRCGRGRAPRYRQRSAAVLA
jgi:hypothetical protein